MNKLTFGALAAATAVILPFAAQAQQLPAAVVAVVDSQRILQQCTVCTAANTQLQQQQQSLQARAQQLSTPLETEGTAIQAAINALPAGQQPDAALQARIQAYRTQQENARREVGGREEQIRRNQAFILQQIQQRVAPAVQQIAQQRGATVALDASNIAWSSPAVDITPAVVALVNQNTTPLNVNAPPPAQQPAQPQQPQPQQPRRPQGR